MADDVNRGRLPEIPGDLREEYLKFFQDPNRFVPPTRDTSVYPVSTDFFELAAEARSALEGLLKGLPRIPRSDLDEGVYAEFVFDTHGQTDTNEERRVRGFSGSMLNAKGVELALNQNQSADYSSLVVAGDLPRALHHALLKYYPEMQGSLHDTAETVKKEMDVDDGIISPKTHLKLVECALANGIIPTPLARGQFYGPMELFPEHTEDFSKELREENPQLYQWIQQLPDSTFFVTDDFNRPISENRFLFYMRTQYLLDLFAPKGPLYEKIKSRSINIIAHGGTLDLALAYFRHLKDTKEFHLERRPKPEVKGETIAVKVDSDFSYLNDPQIIDEVKERTATAVEVFRRASLDEHIQRGEEILDAKFLGFEKKDDRSKYESSKVPTKQILDSQGKVLILGDPGQGKSTFAADFSQKLNEGIYGSSYVPVLVSLRSLSSRFASERIQEPTLNQIVDAVFGDVLKHGKSVVKTLNRDYNFVFILDGYDELTSTYTGNGLIDVAIEELGNYGKVVVTSRFIGFDSHENSGYLTLNINGDAIISNIDAYLARRVNEGQRESFKKFLESYNESVTGNYLMLYLLTRLHREGQLDLENPPTKTEIYGQTTRIMLTEHERSRGRNWTDADLEVIAEDRTEMLAKIAYDVTVHGKTYTKDELLKDVWRTWKPKPND